MNRFARLALVILFLGTLFALSFCKSKDYYSPVRHFKNIEKQLQEKFMLTDDSSVIDLPEGDYLFSRSLILEGKHHITIRGQGKNKTVLSFKAQQEGAEGIRIANCSNITLENFSVEDAKGDNIKVTDTDGITFRNIKVAWTGEISKKNGSYGLYPVICKNVVIENCEVLGSSDAGIYVGQSEQVIIRNNKAYWNVAGIESENCENVEIYGNEAYDNTGGILVFDLPGLTRYGKNIKVYQNKIFENNFKNFAAKGSIVGIVPAGTGLLVLATRNVEAYNNDITDNKTIGAGIISYELVVAMEEAPADKNVTGSAQTINQQYKQDTDYNPYPGQIFVHDNNISNNYTLPDLGNDFGKLFLWKFGLRCPDVAWDGIKAENYYLENGSINPAYKICVKENEQVKTVILDAANGFKDIKENPKEIQCDI